MYRIQYRVAYPNELYHHGIKGQKWGRRRFQNVDGSLTSAGKLRYSKQASSAGGSSEKTPVSSFKDGTKTYTKYSDGSVRGYDSSTGGYFSVSSEYYDAISGGNPSSYASEPVDTTKASEDYRNELAYNSLKNKYPKNMTSTEYFKDEPEKKNKVKQLVEKIKEVAASVAETVSDTVGAVKSWLTGLFSGKKSESSSKKSSGSGPYNFTLEGGRTVYKGRG